MKKIDRIEIAVIKNEIINEPLSEMQYGFLTIPKFQDHGTELDIIFDLLVPISDFQYILTMSGSRYFLHKISKEDYVDTIEPLSDLIQMSMEYTRRMFIQCNPDYAHIEIRHFNKNLFFEEIEKQFKEQGFK